MGLPAVAGWESAAVDGASPSEPALSVFMLELATSLFTRVLQPRMRLTGKSAYSQSVCVSRHDRIFSVTIDAAFFKVGD